MTYQEFWQTPLGRHLYSFIKTYLTVFLALYLRDVVGDVQEGGNFVLLNMAVIVPAAKWAVIAVLRNIYKIIVGETPLTTK